MEGGAIGLRYGGRAGRGGLGLVAHQEGPLRGTIPGDPLLIKEKVSRIAYQAQLEVIAILPEHGTERRARQMLRNAALA